MLRRSDIPLRVIKRFQQSIKRLDDGCWYWTRAISDTGYGKIGWRDDSGQDRTMNTHQLSWIIYNDKIPDYGLLVLHVCDIRRCVNPFHLYLGTRYDNVRDMWERGNVEELNRRRNAALPRGADHWAVKAKMSRAAQ